MAVLALATIVTAAVSVTVQSAIDYNDHVIDGNDDGLCDDRSVPIHDSSCEPNLPSPNLKGFFTAFSSIMYAFGGLSTFPTIQADMKERKKFPISALMGCGSRFSLQVITKKYFETSSKSIISLQS